MIYVNTPFYNGKSNGISVAYELVRILNQSGIAARILCTEDERYVTEIPEELKQYYISKAARPQKVGEDDIVIYLDTAVSNTLQANHTVYWLLNKPGVLTGERILFQPDDILVAFSTLVHQQLPQLFLLKDERELFTNIRRFRKKRTDMVSIYFGKVNPQLVLNKNPQLEKIIRAYKKVNVITRLCPLDREEALRDIAQSDLLISYDALSNMNYEATLLGTPVLLMDDSYGLAHITYNVGNYGYAFCEADVTDARKSVNQAYEVYCRHLESQEESVIASVRKIIELVSLVKSNPNALAANQRTNQMAANDFLTFHEEKKLLFVNIDFPDGIPSSTRKILPRAEKKSETTSCMNTQNQNETVSWSRKIYTKLKPWWVDNMYRKLAGDLKLHELVFLMFRRLFIFLKR